MPTYILSPGDEPAAARFNPPCEIGAHEVEDALELRATEPALRELALSIVQPRQAQSERADQVEHPGSARRQSAAIDTLAARARRSQSCRFLRLMEPDGPDLRRD